MEAKCKIVPFCMADNVKECKFFEDDGKGKCSHVHGTWDGENLCSSWRVVRHVVMHPDFEVELD